MNKKKFDIRQWVLVTDWNPLTVWAYEESYIRMAALEYDADSKDRNIHLTNNFVVKNYLKKEFKEEYGSEDDNEQEFDNIISYEEFGNYLNQEYRQEYQDTEDIYKEIIWKQIKQRIMISA